MEPKDGELLGLGGQKIVRAKILDSGQCVAIMHARNPDATLEEERNTMKKLMGFLHLLQLVEFIQRPAGTIITEFARFGSVIDLYDHLEFNDEEADFTNLHIEEIIKQVALGLEELAALRLRHGDLAPRNILVFEFVKKTPNETLVKLGDFGDTCLMQSNRLESLSSLRNELYDLKK
jgi:serine/threonine protein kinase